MSWVAVAIGGSALLGAGASLAAAGEQSDAAAQAAGLTREQYQQTRKDLMPWMEGGKLGFADLLSLMGIGREVTTPGTTQRVWEGGGAPPTPGGMAAGGPFQIRPQGGGLFGGRDVTSRQLGTVPGMTAPGQWVSRTTPAQYGATFDPNAPLVKPFTMADFQASPSYQFNIQEGEKALNKAAAARGMYYAPATMQDLGKYSQGVASREFQTALENYYNQQGNVYNRLFGISGAGQAAAGQTGAFGSQAAGQIGQNITGGAAARAGGLVGASNALTGGAADLYNQYMMRQILNQPTYGMGGGAPGVWGV